MINHEVPNFGTYQYDQDLYDTAMARTVPSLLAEVLEQVRDLDKGKVTQARKLRKAELAAMVAEWATGARGNERYHEQATFEMQAMAAFREAEEARQRARETGRVAYGHATAVVRVGGQQVRGKVVDTVLRTPNRDGSGRVVLVVQHEGSYTRTMHTLAETIFEGATS